MNIAVFSPSLYVHFEVPLRVQGAGCRVQCSGCRVEGPGCRDLKAEPQETETHSEASFRRPRIGTLG